MDLTKLALIVGDEGGNEDGAGDDGHERGVGFCDWSRIDPSTIVCSKMKGMTIRDGPFDHGPFDHGPFNHGRGRLKRKFGWRESLSESQSSEELEWREEVFEDDEQDGDEAKAERMNKRVHYMEDVILDLVAECGESGTKVRPVGVGGWLGEEEGFLWDWLFQ